MLRAITQRLFRRPSTAIVVLSHSDDPRIVRHFDRLRAESHLPALRSNNTGLEEAPASTADIVLAEPDIRAALPRRYEAMIARKLRVARGYVDLPTFAAMIHPKLADFDYVWAVESDVDFSGRWSEFFGQYERSTADFLSFRIRQEAQSPQWVQWKHLKAPSTAARLTSFEPITRFSRRYIGAYCAAIATGEWDGHFEALGPSVAATHGLSIEDMGAGGDYSVYRGPWRLNHATFGYRPVRQSPIFTSSPTCSRNPAFSIILSRSARTWSAARGRSASTRPQPSCSCPCFPT